MPEEEAKMPKIVRRPYERLLTGLLVITLLPGTILGLTKLEDSAARIDRLLAGRYAADAPGAAVLVARKRAVVLRKGYGLANLEHRIAASPQTVFRLASVSKVFTAAAVLILAEKGRLGLDDPASKYIADYPWKKGVPALRDLLGHTSGIHDYLDRPDNMKWVRGEYTVQELIDSFKDRAVDFAPGEQMAYSNSNYILLGAILEKVIGQPLPAAVQDLVLRPLGLKQTFYNEELAIIPGRAAGYEPFRESDDSLDWTRFRNVRYYTMSCLYASGGYLSTLDDLYTFYRGLADGKLLGRDMFSQSLEPVRLAGSKTAGGSVGGWQIDRFDGRTVYMKGGALPGVCAWMLFLPDEDLCVILLSNRSAGEPRCGQVALEIAKLALAS
jgi:CubicO group peptidase (beta-lactamase class C family)